MTEFADVRTSRRIPIVWVVPIVAAALGLWMVVDNYLDEGPSVNVEFATAEGVEAGKTKVKVRNVDVGIVSQVSLHDTLDSVVLTLDLDPSARRLIRADTEFWVVRARIGQSGVSGLGTILSGGYIEFSPGTSKVTSSREFKGLEEAPVTPLGTPGLKVFLMGESTGTVNVGSPILYRGFRVGRIEHSELNITSHEIEYSAFIEAPYDRLVTSTSRFFNASGVSATVGADGVKITTGSLQSIVAGGVSFDRPRSLEPGERVQSGSTFRLYSDQESSESNPHNFYTEYVVEFTQSVRGVWANTPVEFRGIQIGTTVRLMLTEAVARPEADGTQAPIPVLIKLEPGRLKLGDSAEGVERMRAAVRQAVSSGMRATIETANLLTGGRVIVLDYHDDLPTKSLGRFEQYATIPTTITGIGALEQQLSALLQKLNDLEIETTVEEVNQSLAVLRGTLAGLQEFLASEELQQVPASVNTALESMTQTMAYITKDAPVWERLDRTNSELIRALQDVQDLARTLENAPNSVVFPLKQGEDPIPKAEP